MLQDEETIISTLSGWATGLDRTPFVYFELEGYGEE